MKVGIIVGIKTDSISEERFPEWLSDIPQKYVNMSKESWGNKEYGLGSDVGTAYYVQKYSKHDVDILTKKDISLKTFNQYDVIVGLYDPYYYSIQTKDSSSYKKYTSIIQRSSAKYINPVSLQKFILDKKKYMEVLQKHNLPVVRTISFTINNTMDSTKILSTIKKQCEEWGSSFFITKPQPGGFGIGFKKWDIAKLQERSFNSYISKIMKQVRIEKPLLLVQEFIPDFELFHEIRTYWLNGTYSHSLGTIIDPSSIGVSGFEKINFAYPENEYDVDEFETYEELPGIIDPKLIHKLKKIGKQVFPLLPKDKTGVPYLLRIDFGCCMSTKDICREYFINEIEYLPNIFPEYNTHIDVLQKVGKALITKINSLKKINE